MDNDLDTAFLERISSFEKELLTPLVDRSSLVVFNCRWTSLNDDIQAALKANALKSSTITVAYSLANRVARMIKTFMDLETLAETLMTSLLDETSSMQDPPPSTCSTYFDTTLPPYIKPSHDWLVGNIHNPYPSVAVRDTIAQKSGSARKDVDNWFKDARKRIGWNDARKTYFSNKRADIVDAATRFYANDEKLSLSQGAEHALISIMRNAKDLYFDKFDETILVTKLASVVKDLTPATKAEAKAERLRQARLKKDRDSYPSPDRSPEPCPSPVPCDDRADQSISITSRKRRDIEPGDSIQDEGSRPEKRLRLEASPSSPEGVAFPLGLPSPAPSIGEPLQVTRPTTVPSLPSPASVLVRRKRRLSESDGQVVPKRPCPIPAGSHPQIASDSLPLSNNNLLFSETSFDGWFKQIFDCPEVSEISPSGFSVELGNLSDFDCETPTESRPTSPKFSEETFQPLTLEVADIPTVSDVPWNQFDFCWTNNSSLPSDNLKQSNSLVNFVGQEPLPKPLAQDIANFQVSSQVSCSANELENFFSLSNPSIVDPVAIPLNPASNETWDFSESSLNRDDASIFGKHHAGFESNNGLLASFDFSDGADFLSAPDTIYLPTPSRDKSREEKEKEFREACEKAQRLALELQKDDLFAQ